MKSAKRRVVRRKTPPVRGGAPREIVNPKALIDMMMKQWKPAAAHAVAKVKGHVRYKARRRALSRVFPRDTLVIPSGREKIRANDSTYRFRPGSDFYYLTGNTEPDCVLVMLPKGRGHEDILFVEPNPGRTDPTFFTDRAKGELWVGRRLGVPESRERYQVDRCEPIADLARFLRQEKRGKVRIVRGLDPTVDAAVRKNDKLDPALPTALAEERLIKDEIEVAAIRRAAVATRCAFEDVIVALKHASTERELEGVFNTRARVEGNDVGFTTIVASGEHACILHWTANNGRLRKRDLLLLDAGVESNEIYTADLTRTLPMSGRFQPAQRELYDLVIEAQDAAFAAVKPGNDFLEPHRASIRVLAHGLERLGILAMPAEEALKDEHQFHKRFTLHNTSHMLGLDVHDCAAARPAVYRYGKLKAGMVLTVEPGLYFQTDDLMVPARYRGLGIRVEDDVLVTTRGCQLLTDAPRASDDVERWMHRLWQNH
ncbi:MAG: aminopeptidase P N-terminal domain-containing protein [Deltaproteobacteria bacterium]|nr:aminopeptidase P N-terminal domain-containing protein [Deltaproteobacteria bacterium]